MPFIYMNESSLSTNGMLEYSSKYAVIHISALQHSLEYLLALYCVKLEPENECWIKPIVPAILGLNYKEAL